MSSSSATTTATSLSSTNMIPFLAGTVFGLASSALVGMKLLNSSKNNTHNNSTTTAMEIGPLPEFAIQLQEDSSTSHRCRVVRLREWEDLNWRDSNGWKGRDLCHNPHGQAVRVLQYYYYNYCDNHNASFNDQEKMMVGVVWFGPHAESHRGLCHGGAMTSLMDDFCGHMAFIANERPWSGATVQVNVSLQKPVPIGSILRIIGSIRKREGRKVYVDAVLDNGIDQHDDSTTTTSTRVVYATLEGLSIDGVKMSQQDDSISTRTWEEVVVDHHVSLESSSSSNKKSSSSGRLERRDSSWNDNDDVES
eukprot:scaffold623_cov83-Cylindrotheca_fusiformis.AAC.3